ncbi:MAG: N-6 DNA methylase [Nanoarchaeota archaeon]|nr:N-6 DNA methylase [Nanoarchaeota archaeon]
MVISERWIRKRYYVLRDTFGNKPFTKKEAQELFKKMDLSMENINELFSTLSKKGFIEMEKKGTKYYYMLQEPKEEKKSTTREELHSILMGGADLIRNRDYRLLLILLFYKAMSDKWKKKVEELLKEGYEERLAYHIANEGYYYLYDENEDKLYSWDEVSKNRLTLPKDFLIALNKIADMNEKFSGLKLLVDRLGFTSFVSNEENKELFSELVSLFSRLDLRNANYDLLGAGYEWILSKFAPTKAKAGEVYTPREVIRLLVNLLDIQKNSDILDPACGSAAMLIESYRYVSAKHKDGRTLKLIGQEQNEVTGVIGKLNLVLHGIKNYEIFIGDSLSNQRFKEADYVIANPPWNLKYPIEGKLNDRLKQIYSCGITPKQSADWLWIQLMLHFSKKKVGVVIDNGCLFRGGKEKSIRSQIIDNDKIECVILLPEKLFYNTGAPGAIIILNKNKSKERKNKILFINASQEFEKHPDVRKLNILGQKNIEKISNAYKKFKNIKGFSRVVSQEEIKENEYNLNVTLYVFPEEEEEDIDVNKEWKELGKVEKEIKQVEEKINEFLELMK